jgi:hypothetical protein
VILLPDILATPITVSKEAALAQAEKYYLARLISRSRPKEAELHYFPYYNYKVEMELQKSVNPFFKPKESNISLDVIVSATGGKVSMSDFSPKTLKVKCNPSNIVDARISQSDVAKKVEKEVKTTVFRRMRKRVDISEMKSDFFYRPLWVVFYGEKKEGSRVHYVIVPADGYDIKRTT